MSQAAAIAAHRFGLGEASLGVVGNDGPGWLLAQIGPADAQSGADLPDTAAALARYTALFQQQTQARLAAPPAPDPQGAASGAAPQTPVDDINAQFRLMVQADQRARLATAAVTTRPYPERLALFWSNHFSVSTGKGTVRGLAGAFERDAIRPHVAGSFEALLGAAVRHPAMLRYLDNDFSSGPASPAVRRLERLGTFAPGTRGLNENLAREVLELHTLGVNGGYTQADVTAFAAVLTGWRPAGFQPAWHEPGPKTVLGRRYAEGPQALGELLRDLALHPSTARFIATKLGRHFLADDPPASLVDRLAAVWQRTEGDLQAVATELVRSPEAWRGGPSKLKTPEEFVISSARLLGLGGSAFERASDGGTTAMGQRPQGAPSPAGWSDRAADWLGPDAVWKRVEWANRVGARVGGRIDGRILAADAMGPWLSPDTRRELERAADGQQALTLLLLAPEFQRR
jgi:uncharacterized protein (DUF1800 family)